MASEVTLENGPSMADPAVTAKACHALDGTTQSIAVDLLTEMPGSIAVILCYKGSVAADIRGWRILLLLFILT